MDERLRFTNLRYTSIRFLETWRARQRIPRDITCSYSRVFYRQSISVHVSHAAKKNERIVEANRSGIDSPRETDPREERGVVSISRLAKARGTRDGESWNGEVCGARSTPFAYRTKSSFIKILRLHFTEAERKNAGVARLPRPPPLYGNLIIYLV